MRHCKNLRNSQQGSSIIEMMVTAVISLFILAGVISLFIATRYSISFNDGLRSMQENGRQAAFVLQNAIRHAGLETTTALTASLLPVDMGNSHSSQLTLRWQSDVDCNGNSTLATATPGIATDRYFYNAGSKQVVCQGSASASSIVIVDNVESLAFLYGQDSDADGMVENYVPFGEVADEADVAAIAFALLVVTDNEVKDQASAKTYTMLDQQMSFNDKMGRMVFQSSVLIRNRKL